MRAPQLRRLVAILSSAVLLVAFTAGPATAGTEKWPVSPAGGPTSGWCDFLCYYNECDPDHPAVVGIQRAIEAKYGPGVACACTVIPVCPK